MYGTQDFLSCELLSFIYLCLFFRKVTAACMENHREFFTTFSSLNLQGSAAGKVTNKSLNVLILKAQY